MYVTCTCSLYICMSHVHVVISLSLSIVSYILHSMLYLNNIVRISVGKIAKLKDIVTQFLIFTYN